MEKLYPIFDHLWVLVCLFQSVWAWRLWRLRLVQRYPTLFTYLTFTTALTIVAQILYPILALAASGSARLAYGWFWVIIQPLNWAVYFAVLVEIYKRMLGDFVGLQRLGELALYGATGATGLIFLSLIFVRASAETWQAFWTLQQRNVHISLTMCCAILVLVGVVFHLPVTRNLRFLFTMFAIILAGEAVLRLVQELFGNPLVAARRIVMPVLNGVCVAWGALTFSRVGETVVRPAWPREPVDGRTEGEMIEALQSVNDFLLRLLRS